MYRDVLDRAELRGVGNTACDVVSDAVAAGVGCSATGAFRDELLGGAPIMSQGRVLAGRVQA